MNIYENIFNRNFITKSNFLNNSKNNHANTSRFKTIQTIPICYSSNFMKIPAMNILNKDYSISKKIKRLQYSSNRFNNKNQKYLLKSINKGKICSLFKNDCNNKLLVKKGGIVFCLRKIYIILPENIKLIKGNLRMKIYFPIKDADIKINKISTNDKGIFCYNIDNIFEEVKKKLGIYCNPNEIKMNMYGEDFNLIKNDNQLMEKSAKNKLIYVKIGKVFSKQTTKNYNFCFKDNKNKDDSKVNFLLDQRSNSHSILEKYKDHLSNNNSLYNCVTPIKGKRYSLSNYNKEKPNNFFTITSIEKFSPLFYNVMENQLNPIDSSSNLIPEAKITMENFNINNVKVQEERNTMYFPRIKSKGLWKSNSHLQVKNRQKNQKNISTSLNFQNKFINSRININKETKEILCESIDSISCGNQNISKDIVT